METQGALRQSGIEQGGLKGQIPVLPSREPIKNWQQFWQNQNNALMEERS